MEDAVATSQSDASTTAYTSYDAVGHVLSSNQTTAGNTYSFGYTYNLAGARTSETYPSGRVVSTCYDGANRVSIVSWHGCGNLLGWFATNVTYAAHGAVTQYQMGNNVWHNAGYNSRLQMSGFTDAVNNSNNSILLTASLNWGSSNNNGNLQSVSYNNGGPGYPSFVTFNQNFTYDGLNRLKTATDSGGWSRSFAYDAYGNMTPSGTPAPPTVSFNTNNQIVSAPYDQAGNLTSANGNTLGYDFESRIVSETDGVSKAVETYVVDGNGNRVEKYGPGGAGKSVFVYDALGRMAAEYTNFSETPNCLTCYLTPDHLGTARVVTDQAGNVVARHDYLPFGEEVAASQYGRDTYWGPGSDTVHQKFTGKERDAESGLDYFGARYYGSGLGRWSSPDVVNVTDERALSPGTTLNKYVYGGDNPLKFIDPDGRDITVFYERGLPTGHVMVAASNPRTNDFAFMSVGPQKHLDPAILANPSDGVPGTTVFSLPTSGDDLRRNFAALTIQTSPEVAQQAIDAIRNGAGTGNWSLFGNNCTSACARLLKDIGLSVGDDWLPWTPDVFWDMLRTKYGKPQNWFVRSIEQQIGPKNGTDYGRPSYGTDTFNWLIQQLNAPLKACVTTPGLNGGPSDTICQ